MLQSQLKSRGVKESWPRQDEENIENYIEFEGAARNMGLIVQEFWGITSPHMTGFWEHWSSLQKFVYNYMLRYKNAIFFLLFYLITFYLTDTLLKQHQTNLNQSHLLFSGFCTSSTFAGPFPPV